MDDIEGKIVENENVTGHYHLLTVRLSKPMGAVVPGQFIMLRMDHSDIFLRRPFSIYECNENTLSILYKVVGRGTGHLSRLGKNEGVFVLGPLGNGFKIETTTRYAVIAGGIGIAGVHCLIKNLREKATIFYGCSNKEEIALLRDLVLFRPMIATMDGSYGFQGNVVELFAGGLQWGRAIDLEILACGPENMLKSLQQALVVERPRCQVLVEERMACGLGLCFGCVKRTLDEKEPWKRVCKEGPVFDLWEICL